MVTSGSSSSNLLRMRDRDRLPVDVGDARVRVVPVHDLVHVARGRNTRTQVEELVDAELGEVAAARPRYERLARTAARKCGNAAAAASAASRSTAKFWPPPSR